MTVSEEFRKLCKICCRARLDIVGPQRARTKGSSSSVFSCRAFSPGNSQLIISLCIKDYPG